MKLIIASIVGFLILACAKAGKLRIIGGSKASNGQFPHQVSLVNYQPTTDNYQHFCGGSILNPTTILTAAHCVCDSPQQQTIVVTGTNKLSSGGYGYRTKTIQCHPFYNSTTVSNDIAIIKLLTPIQYSQFVKSIKLPTENIAENAKLILSGWGYIKFIKIVDNMYYAEGTDDLQYIQLNNMNIATCANLLAGFGLSNFISNQNVCTSSNKIGSGACKGDSGGPLIGEDGMQYGIVSWSVNCNGRPDVFTNVYYYKRWIENML